MSNDYIFAWSDDAITELQSIYDYLLENFGEAPAIKLANAIQAILSTITANPNLYPVAQLRIPRQQTVRTANILRYNRLYFSIDDNNKIVNILLFFSNRQNPNRIDQFFNPLI